MMNLQCHAPTTDEASFDGPSRHKKALHKSVPVSLTSSLEGPHELPEKTTLRQQPTTSNQSDMIDLQRRLAQAEFLKDSFENTDTRHYHCRRIHQKVDLLSLRKAQEELYHSRRIHQKIDLPSLRKAQEELYSKIEEEEYQERLSRQRMYRPGFAVVRGIDGGLCLVPEEQAEEYDSSARARPELE